MPDHLILTTLRNKYFCHLIDKETEAFPILLCKQMEEGGSDIGLLASPTRVSLYIFLHICKIFCNN